MQTRAFLAIVAATMFCCGTASAQLSENFESTAAGALPSGWTSAQTGVGVAWQVVTDSAHGAGKSVWTDNTTALGTATLTLPAVTAAGPVTLDFWSSYVTEGGGDGWKVEVNVNGAGWVNTGQRAWRMNGYNYSLATVTRCFSGVLGSEWTRRVLSVSANPGESVQFRFVMSCNTFTAPADPNGVWIDDISITTGATGACCLPGGACVMETQANCAAASGEFNSAAACASALCLRTNFAETEPNDTKAQAMAVNLVNQGDYLSGTTTAGFGTDGINSPDFYIVKTPAAPLGVYRHRLNIESTGNLATTDLFNGAIRGFNQTPATLAPWAGVVGSASTSEASIQSTGTSYIEGARVNQWYGFGKQEQITYQVLGTAATTAAYRIFWTSEQVTPTDIGTYTAGNITISAFDQGHTTNTDIWVYDSNFDPIEGYGNESSSFEGGAPGASTQSWLTRPYTPGVYYLAMTTSNLANNKASPSDDGVRGQAMTDFPDSAVNASALIGSTTIVTNHAFSMTDAAGTVPVPASRTSSFEILWFRFTVVAAPNVFGSGVTTPFPVNAGTSAEFRVTVIPGANAPLTDIANPPQASGVRVNVAQISGNTAPDWLYLTRDGATANWKATFSVPAGTPTNVYALPFEVTQTGSSPSVFSGNLAASVVPPPPPNADCATAAALTSGVFYFGDNFNQATNIQGINCATITNARIKDVWFSFNPGAAGGEYAVSTCGSSFDSLLDVYATTNCAAAGISTAANNIACAHNSGPLCDGSAASLIVNLNADTTYLIRLTALSGATPAGGDYAMLVAPAAAIGVCCGNATGACSVTYGASCPFGTTYSPSATTCSPGTPSTTCPPISVCCGNASGVCTVLYAGSCGANQTQDFGQTSCSPGAPSSSCPAIGACCDGATGACSVIFGGSCAEGALFNAGQTACAPGTPSTSCPITNVCCNDVSGVCVIRFDNACPSGSSLPSGNPASTTCSAPNPCPASGACCTGTVCTEMLAADSGSCAGAFTPDITCTPNICLPNDVCMGAIALSVGQTVPGAATDATDDLDSTCNAPSDTHTRRGVWYSFTTASGGTLVLTEGTTNDVITQVFSGPCGALVPVSCSGIEVGAQHELPGAGMYLILLGLGGTTGTPTEPYSLSVDSFTPSDQNCCRGTTCLSVAAGSCTGTVAGSNSVVVTTCTGNTNAGCCFGDYDHNGTKDITDIFTFLNAWFSASTYADITSNGASTPDITDIFTFLNAWFGTCS